jgi:hypothetical protein
VLPFPPILWYYSKSGGDWHTVRLLRGILIPSSPYYEL